MMKDKHIRKYMRLAKQIGEDQNPCYSRHIGIVIVDPTARRILGTGYNGPPRGTPHTTEPGYLEGVVWPQLTDEEKKVAGTTDLNQFIEMHAHKKVCPRRIVGAPSGVRLELCSCAHGEANAIVNSGDDLFGSHMFCWCGVPCIECTKLIINAGIKVVFCLAGDDYSFASRWLFDKAGIRVIEKEKEWCLEENE